MNPHLILAFQDELEKISTFSFLLAKAKDPVLVKRPPSKGGPSSGDVNRLTAANVGQEVRRRYGKRAPGYARRLGDVADASAQRLREVGGSPSDVGVTFGGSAGESAYNKSKDAVRMGNMSPAVYAHELGHAEQMMTRKFDPSRADKPELYDFEADATRRALRAGRRSKSSTNLDDALVTTALGTYHDTTKQRSIDTDEAIQSAARRHPRYKRQLRRADRAADLSQRLKAREDALASTYNRALREAEAAEHRSYDEQLRRGVPQDEIRYRPYDESSKVRENLNFEMQKLRSASERAERIAQRAEERVFRANPFVDKSLYRRMNKSEREVLQREVDEFASMISSEFGPEKAKNYRREVQKALRNQTGGSVGDFLRRINSKSFLRKIR